MLVGNKADLQSQRKTPRALGEQFAQEEGLLFTEASAKSGDGVEAMFMEIGMLDSGVENAGYSKFLTVWQPRSSLSLRRRLARKESRLRSHRRPRAHAHAREGARASETYLYNAMIVTLLSTMRADMGCLCQPTVS